MKTLYTQLAGRIRFKFGRILKIKSILLHLRNSDVNYTGEQKHQVFHHQTFFLGQTAITDKKNTCNPKANILLKRKN
jgi:hypothetical protein